MNRIILLSSALVAGTFYSSDSYAQSGLTGDQLSCARNGVSCSGVSTAVIGAGVEFDRTNSTYDFNQSGLNVAFQKATIGSPFQIIVYSFRDISSPFTSFSNLSFSGLDGFTTSNVNLTDGLLSINLAGVTPTSNSAFIKMDLSTAPAVPAAVPEPATWAMMIGGFGMIGATMRRRKTAVATSVRFA